MVTHLFNAQRGIHHREPGVAGQALIDGRLSLGLILDLTHVAEAICRLVFASAGRRVVMVTDTTAAAGQAAGQYRLGGDLIQVGTSGPPRRLDAPLLVRCCGLMRLSPTLSRWVSISAPQSMPRLGFRLI